MTISSKWKKIRENTTKHPFLMSVVFTLLGGFAVSLLWLLVGYFMNFGILQDVKVITLAGFMSLLTLTVFLGIFVVYPVILTIIEISMLIRVISRKKPMEKGRIFDVVTVSLGVLYSILFLSLIQSVVFYKDWTEVLVNSEQHTPVFSQSVPTVLAFAMAGAVGYGIVTLIPLRKMPPLLLVLGMSAMYLGTFESIIWGIQVYQDAFIDECLLLLPLNCILITARTVLCKVLEWKQIPHEMHKISQVPFFGWCNRILENALLWPVAAFLLMWPLLGLLICILILFGQSPDAFIRAWTETSDWNLSQRVAPQNIYYDEHYLCTVAAGGHEKIVKPLRLGVRHGHKVIVNRQLCVANAFEQVLEEKTPRFHRSVRNFYDKYGFPVARLIHSRYTADLVYVLMKPLEWIFLMVLYLTDVHPEDRIAVQYMPAPPRHPAL